jgi:hypothetical protein
LENLIERGYILETGTLLTPECIPVELFDSEAVAATFPADAPQLPLFEARRQNIVDLERQYLKGFFARNKSNVSRTAG